MMPKRILYLTYGDILSSVFDSQILPLWKRACDEGVQMAAGCFLSPRVLSNPHLRKKLATLKKVSPIPLYFSYLGISYPPRFEYLIQKKISRWVQTFEPHCIHARGPIVAGIAAQIKAPNTKLIFDVRGDTLAELKDGHFFSNPEKKKKALAQVRRLESQACQSADFIFSVSQPLKQYIQKNYSPHITPEVIPCWTSSIQNKAFDHKKIRTQLHIPQEHIVWCYMGSMASWQGMSILQSFFNAFIKKNRQHHLLILSTQKNEAQQLFGNHERLSILSGNREEAVLWARAANFSILFRDDHPINHVACPMKFGDYLNAGLPVLVSDHLGDVSSWTQKYHLGKVTQSQSIESIYQAAYELTSEFSNSEVYKPILHQFLTDHLSIDQFLPRYLQAYQS